MVCSIGITCTAVVVFAYASWLEGTAAGFSIFSSSSHLKQMEIQRPCTRAWERWCWHLGWLTTTSAGLMSRDGTVSWLLSAGAFWLEATAGDSSLPFASPHLKQKGTKRPCTRAWERRCSYVGSLLTASTGMASGEGVMSGLQSVVLQLGDV